MDKPKMSGSEVLQERLVMCFTDFANGDWHNLNQYWMRKTLQIYEHNVDDKQKDSLRNLTSFLKHCETANWTLAKSLYSTALKEYEHYVNTKAQEPTAGRRELNDGPHSKMEVPETELIRMDKPKMAGSEVLQERLVMCFTNFANGDWHYVTQDWMRKTLQIYEHNVEGKQKDSLRNLTSFLKHCETGNWTLAKSLYSTALKEYEHYVNTKAQEPTAGRRELNDGPHSKKEVPETELIRHSTNASMRLKHDNPNISALSDPNRPSKLTEHFSELYSNEYPDALEELNGTNSNPVESIKCLLDIVKAAYLFCTKRRKQMNDEQIKLTGSSTDDHVRRYEIELRKTAEKALPNIRQEFMKHRIKVMPERTQWFAEQCVEIVWLMCIQQPPMHLEWVENKRGKFNPDLYEGYTKSGKFIEFCVWPVVRLHEYGPILTRGIAQGCD